MKWRKSSPELIELFQKILPGPPVVARKMFGYPAGFVNGNLFMGLFEDDLILRLPEKLREELLAANQAKRFEPMHGRPMREYLAVPNALTRNQIELAAWVEKSFKYGNSLKPKSSASKVRKTSTKTGKAARSKRK